MGINEKKKYYREHFPGNTLFTKSEGSCEAVGLACFFELFLPEIFIYPHLPLFALLNRSF